MRQIINHFTDDDLYKFTMCCAVIDNFPRARVKYAFTDRDDTVYPAGFAQALEEQILMLESVIITDEEIDFMKRRCRFIPSWFYTYLKGFRFDHRWVRVRQDGQGHLHLDIEGCWSETILLEVKLLAIISELYYMMTGATGASTIGPITTRPPKRAGGCWMPGAYSVISEHAAGLPIRRRIPPYPP